MNATATRTRYILTTNGVDHGETYGSKARALKDAHAYVWAAERMERDDRTHTHVIEVRTVATGKIVFTQTVEVPAKPVEASTTAPNTLDGRLPFSAAPANTPCEGARHQGCAIRTVGVRGVPAMAVHTVNGHHYCGFHSPYDAVTDVNGVTLTVGTTVRIAGKRDHSGIAPVLGFTPNRRVIVDFPHDGILGSYDYRGDCLISVTPETAANRNAGIRAAIFLSAVRIARTTPNAKSITGTLPEMPVLDTVKINTGDTKCGWCDETATHSVLIAGMSHEDFACKLHFAKYYPYLNNAQRQSALCPLVYSGCDHTMAQNSEGYGIACVEYADAHGIAWREAA